MNKVVILCEYITYYILLYSFFFNCQFFIINIFKTNYSNVHFPLQSPENIEILTMNLSQYLCVDKELFSRVYVVNWSLSVSLRLFSGVYEEK